MIQTWLNHRVLLQVSIAHPAWNTVYANEKKNDAKSKSWTSTLSVVCERRF